MNYPSQLDPALGDEIASCVINAFQKLPTKFKPARLKAGVQEWIPLAGIVLHKGNMN